jgi:hypothetical protein
MQACRVTQQPLVLRMRAVRVVGEGSETKKSSMEDEISQS